MQWQELRTHLRHLSEQDLQKVKLAFHIGESAHKDQKRKSGEPYFMHPIAVAHVLADMDADSDTLIAALLHDTLEDTPLSLQEITSAFGDTVGDLVQGVTKLSKADLEKPSHDEQSESLRKIFTLMQGDVRIMVIKLIDRLHNMQTAKFLGEERRRILAQETLDVYVKIADRLCMQDLRDELEALCLQVLEPDAFTHLEHLRRDNEMRGAEVLKSMRKDMRDHPAVGQCLDMLVEPKSWDTLKLQMRTEGAAAGVSAVSVVFVCADTDSCYRMLGALHEHWKAETLSFQDFIHSPVINGYRGLHTTVILPDGTRVRCKMRTTDMHAYARQGITTRCFKNPQKELFEYLPWAEHISPLAVDTKDKSREFWDSLQSDILGQTIIIHGPADQAVHLPQDATALDGAFYLFRDKALQLASMKVNGQEVAFAEPLHHGDVLALVDAGHQTVSREWLESVHTGLATAGIRSALSSTQSESEKLLLGKALLQKTVGEQKKGFIEELAEPVVAAALHGLGYASLHDAYIAIADGHLDPADAYEAIFAKGGTYVPATRSNVAVRYSYYLDDMQALSRIIEVYKRYSLWARSARITPQPFFRPRKLRIMMRFFLTSQEQRSLVSALRAAGANDVGISRSTWRYMHIFALSVLVILWGLDPVVARLLLSSDVNPFELTFIRFATFWIAGSAAYLAQIFLTANKLKPLNPLQPGLVFSGMTLFATAIATYIALTLMPASQYIIFIVGGIAVSTFLGEVRRGRPSWQGAASLVLLIVALLQLTALSAGSLSGAYLAGIASAAGFALYSFVSGRYQIETGMIRARYPAYLFWVATAGLVLSLPLLPALHLNTLDMDVVLKAAGFSLVFTVLPYVLYFEYMRRLDALLLDKALPFVCVSALAAEAVVTHTAHVLVALPALVLFLIVQSLRKRQEAA